MNVNRGSAIIEPPSPTEIPDQDRADSITDGLATEIITNASALNFTLDSDTLDEIQ